MKIFICASKYNYKHIPPIKEELEKAGHIITLPNCFDDPFVELRTKEESKEKHIELKQKLLKEQVEKIKQNDAILVVNFDKNGQKNYIGGATFLELYKAFKLGKKIFFYNPIPEGMLADEIVGMDPIVINGNLTLIKDVQHEIVYNKLIRDKIPEITAASGWISETRVLKQKEFVEALKEKLVEEAIELKNRGKGRGVIVELADVLEIVDTILKETNIKFSEVRKIQKEKRLKRGGFKKKLFLIKTVEKKDENN